MRKTVSQAAVIQTQIAPPEASFYIQKTGLTEQVYYENDNTYVPNRQLTPLTLTPVVTIYDSETHQSRTATIQNVWWTEVGTGPITSDGTNYVISGTSLVVRKNVPASKPLDINCEVEYLDAQAPGVSYKIEEAITLNTIFDATVVFPRLNVVNEPITLYDPIIDQTSLFTFTAKAILRDVDIKDIVSFQWYGKQGSDGTEYLIDSTMSDGFNRFLCYKAANQNTGKGQGSDEIVLDAMYCDDFYVILRARYLYTPVTNVGSNVNPQTLGWYERTQTTITSPTGNPNSQGWYELVNDIYIPTQDTTVSNEKTYYSIVYTLTTDVTPDSSKRYYTSSGDLFPDKVTRILTWTFAPMDAMAYAKNGSQATSKNGNKVFDTVINTPNRVLSDEQKENNLLFNWKARRSNVSTVTNLGWGLNLSVQESTLRNTDGSNANVYAEIYECGCYERITDSGETVTDDGDVVVDRNYS